MDYANVGSLQLSIESLGKRVFDLPSNVLDLAVEHRDEILADVNWVKEAKSKVNWGGLTRR